jgi:hypothetical protein
MDWTTSEPRNVLKKLLGHTPNSLWGALIPQVILWCFRRFCIDKLVNLKGGLLMDEIWEDHLELFTLYAPEGLKVYSSIWFQPDNLTKLNSTLQQYNEFFVSVIRSIDNSLQKDEEEEQVAISKFLDEDIRDCIMEWLAGDTIIYCIYPKTEEEYDVFPDSIFSTLVQALIQKSTSSLEGIPNPLYDNIPKTKRAAPPGPVTPVGYIHNFIKPPPVFTQEHGSSVANELKQSNQVRSSIAEVEQQQKLAYQKQLEYQQQLAYQQQKLAYQQQQIERQRQQQLEYEQKQRELEYRQPHWQGQGQGQGQMPPHLQGQMPPHLQGQGPPHLQGQMPPHLQGPPHLQLQGPQQPEQGPQQQGQGPEPQGQGPEQQQPEPQGQGPQPQPQPQLVTVKAAFQHRNKTLRSKGPRANHRNITPIKGTHSKHFAKTRRHAASFRSNTLT